MESLTDTLQAIESKLYRIKARDMMTRDVITTRSDITLSELSRLMTEKRVSGLPVVKDDGSIEGIITTTDLFVMMGMIRSGVVIEKDRQGVCDPMVKFIMSQEVITIDEDTSLGKVIDIMKTKGIHTIPVVSGGKLIGVVGRHDAYEHFYRIVSEVAACRE